MRLARPFCRSQTTEAPLTTAGKVLSGLGAMSRAASRRSATSRIGNCGPSMLRAEMKPERAGRCSDTRLLVR